MWAVLWLVLAVVLLGLITAWIAFTATRLDRLHGRVDAAQAALDAQLDRRAHALLRVAESPGNGMADRDRLRVADVARAALQPPTFDRADTENAIGRAITELSRYRDRLPASEAIELGEAATRVLIARRFYNDAVRDTRNLRSRRLPRLLHLAGHRELPQFFDIDDSMLFAEVNLPDPV